MLIVTAALVAAAIFARSSLLIAAAVLALGACLGARAGYWHATYALAIYEPAVTIVCSACWRSRPISSPRNCRPTTSVGADRRAHLRVHRHFRLLGRLALGRQSASRPLPTVNAANSRPHPISAADHLALAFTVGWAIALLGVGLWGMGANRRWVVNVAAVFGAIHFYTQWFDRLGPPPYRYYRRPVDARLRVRAVVVQPALWGENVTARHKRRPGEVALTGNAPFTRIVDISAVWMPACGRRLSCASSIHISTGGRVPFSTRCASGKATREPSRPERRLSLFPPAKARAAISIPGPSGSISTSSSSTWMRWATISTWSARSDRSRCLLRPAAFRRPRHALMWNEEMAGAQKLIRAASGRVRPCRCSTPHGVEVVDDAVGRLGLMGVNLRQRRQRSAHRSRAARAVLRPLRRTRTAAVPASDRRVFQTCSTAMTARCI